MEEKSFYTPKQFDLICRLSNYRAKLEEELGDQSLLFIKTSPGLFLYDLAQALGLNDEERDWVLGDKLGNEICQLMPEALEFIAE